jgi:predicted lysophospholipase L1 biosynthesis ABC-type transport system permease subunit
MWMLLSGDLRRRWVELALAALVVAVVVAGIVAHRAVTSSAESAVHDLAHRLGRNMLVVPAETDLAAFYRQEWGVGPGLPDTVPDAIRASPLATHIRSVEARLYGRAKVGAADVIVVGEELDWPRSGDVSSSFVGPEAARRLGVAPGQPLRIGDEVVNVIGIASPAPDGLDAGVFVPLAVAQRILKRPGELSALRLAGCWCRIDVASLASEVEKLLPGTRAVTVAGIIRAQKGAVSTMQRYSAILHGVGIAVVAVVIATIVASQVRRRSREIGLLVAIGAPPWSIVALFTAQAAVAGAVGGALGYLLSIPAARWLGTASLGAPLHAAPGVVLPAIGLAALASAVAAFVPATRAAALDPTVVLRET